MRPEAAYATHRARQRSTLYGGPAWGPMAVNVVLCDLEGRILASHVGDRTALAVIRAHQRDTGHAVVRQRTRYQAWPGETRP